MYVFFSSFLKISIYKVYYLLPLKYAEMKKSIEMYKNNNKVSSLAPRMVARPRSKDEPFIRFKTL